MPSPIAFRPNWLAKAPLDPGGSPSPPTRIVNPISAHNPVLVQDVRRLRRQSFWVIAMLLLLWFPATWFLRVYLLNGPALATTVWASFALAALPIALRPDIFVAVYFAHALLPESEWRCLREHLAMTFLTPREILGGKVLPPLLMLCAMNLAFGLYFYPASFDPASMTLGSVSPQVAIGLTTAFAVLEDFFFAAICVVLSFWAVIQCRDRLRATLLAATTAFAIGLLCAVWSVVAYLIGEELMYHLRIDALSTDAPLFINAIFLPPLLVAEAVLIFWLWRRSLGTVASALRGETG